MDNEFKKRLFIKLPVVLVTFFEKKVTQKTSNQGIT